MNALITPSEADALITASLSASSIEAARLADCIGRVLGEPLMADRDLPPYSRAMMDGIAFDSTNLASPLKIAGLHAAGNPPPAPLDNGEAWEIMTGACIPERCDTVVPYEHLSSNNEAINEPYNAGQYIHPAGSDGKAGDTLVQHGIEIGPAEIAIAASIGKTKLMVIRRPKIAIISSGDEAIPIESTPEPWQIRRSNGPMIEAILESHGYTPFIHKHIADDEASTRSTLMDAIGKAEIIILCGGISKGKRDLIRPIMEELLGEPAFHGVSQRPGKPLAFWSGKPHVFALPGNPVSVLATFTRYVLPTLTRMEGKTPPTRSLMQSDDILPLDRLTWLLAMNKEGQALPPKNSGDFVSITGIHGFLEVPSSDRFNPYQLLPFYPIRS